MGITVVKCGGAVPPGPVCADLGALPGPAVLVHGGAPEIARLAGELGVRPRTLESPSGVTSRHTDAAMLDVVTLAMTGRAKPRLLRELDRHGVSAVGLTGLDGRGAVGAKGPLAAMISAAASLPAFPGTVRVIDAVEEELLSKGGHHIARTPPRRHPARRAQDRHFGYEHRQRALERPDGVLRPRRRLPRPRGRRVDRERRVPARHRRPRHGARGARRDPHRVTGRCRVGRR
ncbi:M20/M25/M40 family metallo-hydrolase [Spirillospora sp. CA-294931]|uniref:M20/M25/M40 family metallo-hydrolase n=1 Tax=Spirillospora sp. CA-294931 TaxID=3240042 RepID=UPI003D914ECB